MMDYTVGFVIVIAHLVWSALRSEDGYRGGVAISAARASARSTRVAKSTNSR
jgi:hypothetical protein